MPTGRLWRWMWFGVSSNDSASLTRKTILANVSALLVMLSMANFFVMFLVLFEPAVMRPLYGQAAVAMLSPLVWWLNNQRRHWAARRLIVVLAISCVWVPIVTGQGTVMSGHLYFLMFALMAPALFLASEWRATLLTSTLCLVLFSYYAWVGVEPAPYMLGLPHDALMLTQRSIMATCATTAVLLVLLTELSSAETERQLQLLAHTDQLTELPNRRHFVTMFERERQRASRQQTPLSAAVIDIDYFKRVNDTLGHEGGDAALRHVAQVLREHSRPYDVLARLGGEEFAWLLPGATQEQAMQAAERIRQRLADTPWVYAGTAHQITASIGLTPVALDDDVTAAVARADKALYAAKAAGRNQVKLAC